MNLILLGAPGSGKGTQAVIIKEKFNLPHISTGDIFRENIKGNTELGRLAKSYMDAGNLVPDSVTCDIVRDRLSKEDCKNGFILDGFPRNIFQAEELEKMIKIEKVINLVTSNEVIVDRLSTRRFCPACSATTNTKNHSSENCPMCGYKLIIRDDDKKETVLVRLENYEKSTKPLINFYKEKGILSEVICKNEKEETFEEVEKILKGM